LKSLLYKGILLGTIVLAGCSGISKYDDNEAAAIVKGQEVTVGDLRFLYPDDTALDYLDSAIEVELVKQEVKEMGLDISTNLSDEKNVMNLKNFLLKIQKTKVESKFVSMPNLKLRN
jgi:hypothetical protein